LLTLLRLLSTCKLLIEHCGRIGEFNDVPGIFSAALTINKDIMGYYWLVGG
jgi:hypothetical protein